MILNKDSIFAQRRPVEKVAVPWLGEDAHICVQALPAHVLERSRDKKELGDAFIFANVVVNESGERIYQDSDAAEIAEKVSDDLVRLVIAAAFRLAQVPEERQKAIKKNWGNHPLGKIGESPSLSDTPTPTSSSSN